VEPQAHTHQPVERSGRVFREPSTEWRVVALLAISGKVNRASAIFGLTVRPGDANAAK
jgi:hypothetical protein